MVNKDTDLVHKNCLLEKSRKTVMLLSVNSPWGLTRYWPSEVIQIIMGCFTCDDNLST